MNMGVGILKLLMWNTVAEIFEMAIYHPSSEFQEHFNDLGCHCIQIIIRKV